MAQQESLILRLPQPDVASGRDEEETEERSGDRGGFSPVLIFSGTYICAFATFMAAMNIKRLPRQPFDYGNLLPIYMPADWRDGLIMLMVMWNAHHLRRLAEVLLLHIYTRRLSCLEAIGFPLYHCFFGLWIGWSMNYHLGYESTPTYLLITGGVIFCIGEIGNCACHVMLRRLRTRSPKRKYQIPRGCMFQCVTCPHYLFEILTWLGFSLAAFTFPCVLFTIATLVILTYYARKKHLLLKSTFNGDNGEDVYPVRRKAIFPLIF